MNKEEIVDLLNTKDEKALFKRADEVRRLHVGDEVYLRALIEFSNICRNNCLYCGIRKGNAKAVRYRLSEEEIINTAQNAAQMGFKTVVLQSGEDMYFNTARLCGIIEKIKKLDVALTLSIGERTYEDYKAFYDAGADRYLMRIETTDQNLYAKLHPSQSWQKRHECLLMIKELGYELGSGIMVGLPAQSTESIANDLLYLKELGIDMAGIGPFIPHEQTPLKNEKGGTLSMALRTMAVMRLLMPDINIPATTAMETLHPRGRLMALCAGANVVMPNMTEGEYRKFYELYPGKICTDEKPSQCKTCVALKIESIGRKIGTGYGGHNGKLPSKST